jgi:putative ABC transport system permease protein
MSDLRYAIRGLRLDRAVRVGDITATVVGVVGDIHQRGLETAPTPTIYVPMQQIPRRAMSFIIRTAGDPLLLSGPVREAVRELDPAQAIQELTTLESVIHESVSRSRFLTILLAGFASLALALASIGVYAVLAFAVRQRTREIGIRMALGADRHRTMRLVLRQGMLPVLLGVALGTAAAWGLTRVLSGLLFEIRPFDPPTYAVVTVTLGLVALGACWIPARRAIRIHPMEALRHE